MVVLVFGVIVLVCVLLVVRVFDEVLLDGVDFDGVSRVMVEGFYWIFIVMPEMSGFLAFT